MLRQLWQTLYRDEFTNSKSLLKFEKSFRTLKSEALRLEKNRNL